jgi:hypothetical protein
MSQRITWRSRSSRSKYPWPYLTIRKDLADLQTGLEFPTGFLIGPLPLHAVVELLYRVVQLDWTLEIEAAVDSAPTIVTKTGSGLMRLEKPEWGLPTELEVFKTHRTDENGNTEASFWFENVSHEWWKSRLAPIRIGPGFPGWIGTFDHVPIFEDENGKFWLQGWFDFRTDGTDDPPVPFVSGCSDPRLHSIVASDTLEFDADLVLASSPTPIPIKAWAAGLAGYPTISASLTITATEWFPYQTSAGDPAWNTATGAPANGGPGA